MMLEPQLSGVPVPRPSIESGPYWEGTRLGELRFQRCSSCAHANFGPGLVCRGCRSRDLSWEVSGGTGVVYSWTVVWRPQTPAFTVPYAPAIIRMAEGYDMLSALIGLDHESIHAGLPVAVVFERLTDEITLAFFRPAD
jgi:uncharacterized protein